MLELAGQLFRPDTYLWHPDEKNIPVGISVSGREYFLSPQNQNPDAICITTNGFVKKNGESVMGRGCAKEAAYRYPILPKLVGNHIKTIGNTPYIADFETGAQWRLVTFPVKPIRAPCAFNHSNVVKHMRKHYQAGQMVPGWACKADLGIITESALALRNLTDEMGWKMVVLPRPGCGCGELYWNDVKPILKAILDDRFYAITFR